MWDYVMFWLAKDIKDFLLFLGVCGVVGVGYLVLLALAKISNKKKGEK
jgi:hypothetical protein